MSKTKASKTLAAIAHLDIWTGAWQKKAGTGRGKNGKLTPYGIQKLRELILELAVRGRLVPQDPNDEPASVLLEMIAEEKARLVKEGKIKKQKKLPEINKEDKPFDLPKGWEWVRLGTLFNSVTSGGTPSKRNPAFWDGSIPWASVKDLGRKRLINDTQDHITEEGLEEGSKLAEPGDLLVCTRMGLGKIAIVGTPMAFNQDLKAIKLSSGVDVDFFINSFMTLNLKGKGTTVEGIRQSQLLNYVIGLPPLAEQHCIVAKVDELMALCDRLEQEQTDSLEAHQTLVETLLRTLTDALDAEAAQQAWTRIAQHFDTLFTTEHSIDQLKQTILQLAVMGKLVPQDPNDEPASVLLEKIADEKARLVKEGKIKKQKKLPEITEEEKQFKLPNGWVFTRFGDTLINRDAERVPLSVEERKHRRGEYDYYGASGVIDSIDDYLFDKPLLLIGEDGANLINRATPIAFIARGKYWVNNHAHVLDSIDEIILEYVALHINAISLEPYITGTAQPKMNQAKMNSIVLALPPLAEQHRIVAKVDELMALCDALKARIQDAQTTQLQLADAVVDQAVGQ